MKKTVKIIASLLFISTIASASNKTPIAEAKSENSFKMSMYFDKASGVVNTFFEKQPGKSLFVSLIDEEGNELSKNAISKKSDVARLSLNMSGLADGTYTIKVTDGNEIITKNIRIEKAAPKKAKNFNIQLIQS
ncbi:MAG: hypothetical protein ACI9QN_001155 [Arcticibacterium sp.]|jgi:hypothetical protein